MIEVPSTTYGKLRMTQDVIELCAKLLRAKDAEAQANATRVDIETKLIAMVGHRPEGSETKDHGEYKITTTGKITRKMNWDSWAAVKTQIPDELHPVKLKPELDEKGVKWLQVHKPDLYLLLPIECKPAKTAVEVRLIPQPATEEAQ